MSLRFSSRPTRPCRVQPLHAFYHKDCLDRGEALLREGVGSLMALHDRCHVKVLDEADFSCEGRLQRSILDLDTPEEYAAALAGRAPVPSPTPSPPNGPLAA